MHEAPKVLGGKWRVERRLGAGGMGAVYLATDLTLGRRVAVKLLHASLAEDKTFVARFLREARVMARLDHPSIMPIFACEQAPEGVLLVMKYIEGPTLSAHLKAMGRLSASGTVELLNQLSAGVSLMHRHGLVHRDLKPSNLIMQDDGRVVLLDFGLARKTVDTERLTRPGTALGTGAYMAPEQALDQAIDQRTDLYSVAVIAFQCLTGEVPFPGDAVSALFRRLNSEPPLASALASSIPEKPARVVAQGMAVPAFQRQATLEAFVEEFVAAASPGADEGAKTLRRDPAVQTHVTTPHPDDAKLRALELGQLEPADAIALRQHVDGCDECLVRLDAISANPNLLAESTQVERIGRYVVLGPLGEGGMGRVLRAWDPQLSRACALKLLKGDPRDAEARAQLVREAQAMARVQHPHIVSVFDAGEAESGDVFMAMELVEGPTLDAWLRARPRSRSGGDALRPPAPRGERRWCADAGRHRHGLAGVHGARAAAWRSRRAQ